MPAIICLTFFACKHTGQSGYNEITGATFSANGEFLWFLDRSVKGQLNLYSYELCTKKVSKGVAIPQSGQNPVTIISCPDKPGGICVATGKYIFACTNTKNKGGSPACEKLSIPLESGQLIQGAAAVIENQKPKWYFLVREGEYGWMLAGLFHDNEWVETARGIEGPFSPKTFWLAETDGDPEPEIWLEVYKTTVFYPEPENRPWLYDVTEDGFQKKWQGSRLQHPFTAIVPCP